MSDEALPPAATASSKESDPGRPDRLRVEHGPRLLGIGVECPRLSWWLPVGALEQEGYRLEAQIDEGPPMTAEISSAQSVLCPWPFAPLTSRQRVSWRVQVLTDTGWTPWSDAATFEVGLLDRQEWDGVFIGHPDDARTSMGGRGDRGAIHLRHRFTITDAPFRARVRATALGIYELHLDGTRIGDLELTPGFTAYRSTLEAQTYDITEFLGPGDHEIVATLTDGWYRGSVGFTREEFAYGDRLALLAQIELGVADGTWSIIGTDGTWECTMSSPIVAADLIEGERVDLRVPFPPTEGWTPATAVSVDDVVAVTASPGPPTRSVETYRPDRIDLLDDGTQIVALPENINGWLRIDGSALGPAGTTAQLTHGEALADSGDVDLRNLEVTHFVTQEQLGHGQTDQVTSAGAGGPPFEPRHITHGFQFVRVEGAPALDPDDVTGVMVHSDLVRTGRFSCSDEDLNALHDAAVLSFRGNACEIPTDCPQRERAGWTGDWQLFTPTATFLYDIAGFSDRWLRDLAADQWPDGRVTNHVPDPIGPAGRENAIATFMTGSAGWGDAAVLVPWELWQAYGDIELLDRQYPSMVAWVEFGLHVALTQRHGTRMESRPEPADHEQYLWDAGFHWGEWTEPGSDAMGVFTGAIDQGHVATAYLSRSLSTLATIARVLNRPADADRFAELAGLTRSAWRAEYLHDGEVRPRTQATLTRALAFGLVDDEERDAVLEDLVACIHEAGDHVGTGFLTTPFLLPTLADHGRLDLAYTLLMQRSAPSWLAMIDAGATTIWENWDGLGEDGFGSLNHYSKGAVVTFLHRYVAGIRSISGEPAYRRFEVRPQPGGGITSAEATLDSPYGAIASAWNIDSDVLHLTVTVPPGTGAVVTLPDGRAVEAGPGTHRFETAATQ